MTDTAQGQKPCVLVVDDSRVVRRAIVGVLGPHFEVLEAGDGVEGWRMLRQESRIDVVISDIQMPEMDGYTLICKIRATDDPGLRDIPIIVITSAEDEITRERAYACGANAFVLKPFDAAQLLQGVRAQLGDTAPAAPAAPAVASAPVVSTPATPVLVADSHGSIDAAVRHFDAGLETLRGIKTAILAPHALSLAVKCMALLKYCNAAFKLGLDKELAVIHQRLLVAVKAQLDESNKKRAAG